PAVTVNGTSARVLVPGAYLERVIANLVDNARRYAMSRVEVSVQSTERVATLQVRDDGPGVPDAAQCRIFKPTVRLDEARDRDHGGFGLGLAIVADLCRAYGGTIEVSDAGPGAVFSVRFPLARAASARLPATKTATATPSPAPQPEPEREA